MDEQQRLLRNRFSMRYDQRVDIYNIPLGSGITGAAVDAREPVKVNDTLTDPRDIASHPDIQSEVAVPLIYQDRVIGVIDLESERLGFFTEDHVRMLSLLAPQIAISIEKTPASMSRSRRAKSAWIRNPRAPRVGIRCCSREKRPPIPGLEIALGARPAREITGDIYDFFECEEHCALICFGHSSGKSAAAALYGALISGLLRSLASSRKRPSELMAHLERSRHGAPRRHQVRHAAADALGFAPQDLQHDQCRQLAADGFARRQDPLSEGGGIPVGLLEDRPYDEVEFQAEPGDVILLYSDGVQDQQGEQSPDSEEFGVRRISRLLKKHRERPAAEIVGAFFKELDEFAGKLPISDDQSVIVMKVI